MQQQEGPGVIGAIRQLQEEIDFLLEHDDTRWKQRAKQNWYQNGDKNTPFFHAWVGHRRRINQIQKITDDRGVEWKKPDEISKAFICFYQELFKVGEVSGTEESLMGMENRVMEEMNFNLRKTFTSVEVDCALKQMHPLKSLGPDGMSACFYQHSWANVREEVCMAALDFLNNGVLTLLSMTLSSLLFPRLQILPVLRSIGL